MIREVNTLDVILTTGRTIEQGISLMGTKVTKIAKEATAICFMDPSDMEKLGIEEFDKVKILTSEGSIVVQAKISNEAPHKGIIFMPLGMYANWITPPGDAGIGVPKFKGIKAKITTTNEEIPEINELIDELQKKKNTK
ncbi:MAG: protein fwdD [Asgard group archaeon]|nr:protein fwdD [Asgard group archaeon]